MYSKITNPITGRKVSITGKLGRKILKNYFFYLILVSANKQFCYYL